MVAKALVFFHGIYAIPIYLSIITIIYNKFLESKYSRDICKIMQIDFFDDKEIGGFSIGWIMTDIMIAGGEICFAVIGIRIMKFINIYMYGWIIDLIVIGVIILIYRSHYIKDKKNNNLEINIDIINNAIAAATSKEMRKTLTSARDRIIKQQQLKLVKEGIAAIDRIQESFDYVDVQYDIDRLKAYMELDKDSNKGDNAISFYNDGSVRR
jgi:hypothetical protein